MTRIKNIELLLLNTVYLFLTILLMNKNAQLYSNIINPIYWVCVLIYLVYDAYKYYIRIYLNKKQIMAITVLSTIYIVVYFYIGFVVGFTKNPYSQEFMSIIKNLSMELVPLIGIEITRGVILSRNKHNKFIIIFVTILLCALELNYNVITDLFPNKEIFFQYFCSNIIPTVAVEILCTYLSLKGSFYLSLIYKIFKCIVPLFLPILPNLDWLISGAIGILVPIITYLIFKFRVFKIEVRENVKVKNSYFVTLIFSILLICFMEGAFKYEPIDIVSNSMAPAFERADVVIFEKLNENELKNLPVGTIIIYRFEDKSIAHRINKIIKQNDEVLYKTKGDNNTVCDRKLVKIEQIQGVYKFHIKYIGYPSIWMYNYFNSKKEEEFEF